MNLKELYQEIILEYGKNPKNLGKTENFNKDAKGYNPLCGDKVHVYLKLNENKKVEDISFEGSGCAISMASASIMTDLIKGKEEHDLLPDDPIKLLHWHMKIENALKRYAKLLKFCGKSMGLVRKSIENVQNSIENVRTSMKKNI